MFFLVITIILLFSYSGLILLYRRSWIRLKNYLPQNYLPENRLPFISIIISARNEEQNIGHCIRSIIDQKYPQNKYETIIVDDHSTDKTVSIIQSFQKQNIRIIFLADYTENKILNSYKKKSIATAMQFAKGELIATTDADCVLPDRWLEILAAFYKDKESFFIAMPVAFQDPLPTDSIVKKVLKIFQSIDFMALQGITGASVQNKFHGMCNGANLAYEKKIFYAVNGFEGIDELASGDDMLLMHKIQKVNPQKVMFLKSPEVIVQTRPAETLKEFMNQRIRWASKAEKYTDKTITLVLFLVYFFNAWIFILAISAFFYANAFYLFLISLVVKISIELYFLYPVSIFFQKQKLLWFFIPAQPFHILYTLVAGWLGKFGSYYWKGRKVK